jgi:membrane protease YdiL (CAAX protease family)
MMSASNIELKNLVKGIVTAVLIIPIVFGVNIEYLFIRSFDLVIILFLLIGFVILFFGGLLLIKTVFRKEALGKMKKHEVVLAFQKDDKITLFFWFPLTMVMEELIFRYYLTGFLDILLTPIHTIFLSAIIFGIYHFHVWFLFKNLQIVFSYIGYSFLLGLILGFTLLTLGLFPCIFIHFSLILFIYYKISKKTAKN